MGRAGARGGGMSCRGVLGSVGEQMASQGGLYFASSLRPLVYQSEYVHMLDARGAVVEYFFVHILQLCVCLCASQCVDCTQCVSC